MKNRHGEFTTHQPSPPVCLVVVCIIVKTEKKNLNKYPTLFLQCRPKKKKKKKNPEKASRSLYKINQHSINSNINYNLNNIKNITYLHKIVNNFFFSLLLLSTIELPVTSQLIFHSKLLSAFLTLMSLLSIMST